MIVQDTTVRMVGYVQMESTPTTASVRLITQVIIPLICPFFSSHVLPKNNNH